MAGNVLSCAANVPSCAGNVLSCAGNVPSFACNVLSSNILSRVGNVLSQTYVNTGSETGIIAYETLSSFAYCSFFAINLMFIHGKYLAKITLEDRAP